ncbi:MAG: ATP-binding protein [Candidatus Promineifilaceae bacterium]
MSIKIRLTVLYTLVLVSMLTMFGVAVYFFSQATLLNDIDLALKGIAMQLRDQTEAVALGDVAVLSLPEEELDVFQSATNFFVILDAKGTIKARSGNLADYNYNQLLDPNGAADQERYSNVVHDDRTLRVLTEPLYVDLDGERVLVGHLQVARLLDNQVAVMDHLQLILILTGLAAVSLSLFLGALVINRLLQPLDDMTEAAIQITKTDDLSRRLPDTGRRDEIGNLTMVLNSTLERLEKLFHARQRFLADVSHELRTPLTTIRGNVDLMRRIGEADPEILDVVQEEVERMSRLVGDLMLLARADTGGLPIQRQSVDLDTLFLDVYRQVRSINHDVQISVEDVDQVCVLGDSDRLKQLILNLVDNAIKYTPAGGKVMMSLSKENGYSQLAVKDTGIGIPAEDLPHIFDRFYRVDKARTRAQGGSGLGLSIAKWIVEAHNGRIEVESVVGEGTTFRVFLPVLKLPARIQPPQEEKAVPLNGSHSVKSLP